MLPPQYDGNLTPKQKLERKKQVDRERRELEMRVAAMSANKNREQVGGGEGGGGSTLAWARSASGDTQWAPARRHVVMPRPSAQRHAPPCQTLYPPTEHVCTPNPRHAQVAARKKEMIYGSNVGLPGAQVHHQPPPQERGFEDDDMPNLGSVRIDDGPRAAAPPTRPGNRSIWDVDVPEPGPSVNPYAATLPSQARQQQQQQAARPQTSQQGARASPAGSAGRPGAGAPLQRPATTQGGSRGTPGAYGGGMWDDSDDVLQGSVRGTQRTVRAGLQGAWGCLRDALGHGRAAAPGWRWARAPW